LSYDIIYNKQFVKLRSTREVIPMLLSGSSNCFDIGPGGRNGRRARSWSSMSYYNRKGKLSEKPDLILKKVDAELPKYIRMHKGPEYKPADIRARYGYFIAMVVGSGHCSDTSFDDWRGVFANGIKRSMTIQELDKLLVNIRFTTYPFRADQPAEVSIHNEREYFAELKTWREWQAKDSHRSFSLSFIPYDTDVVLKRLHAGKTRTPKVKTPVEQDHYFVLSNGSYGLLRYTSRGYRYSWSESSGKKFRTEVDAEKFRKSLVDRKRYMANTWLVKRIDQKCTFMV
jgi:hypothetical protein